MIAGMLLLMVSFALPTAEYADYHQRITGKAPREGAVSFAIDARVSKSGNDAYTIKSTDAGAKITGSNLRSVWYGLYDLLERRGGCHWFWDVDVVPQKAEIDLKGLDVYEEARFEYRGLRYFAHRGLTRFQAEHWGPEDWRREIGWCLKRRLNVFMLRIGQDDLYQRTFPDTVGYPDASKDLPGAGTGFDNRTLFWSLEYRGKLRQDVQRYARERGLMIPEDFGTMTHWYSRTPEEFLAKKNPPFLPQATSGYGEKNGLVWDVRDDKWADEYWQLTKTACKAYGEGDAQQLLHTIGLGERRCFTNRADNLALKIASLKKFLKLAHRDYPNAKCLLAGWDFYFTWHPEEVRELVKSLDPKRDIIWDYEGDATRDYRPEMKDVGGNNFTKWGVVGKFPYTFSIFLAYESALDIRANYPLIEQRQQLVQNDPACAGYIFWPESSHTDTLLLRYFTANAWAQKPVGYESVLDEFCASRYGAQAEAMKAIWQKVVPMSYMLDWGDNYGCHLAGAQLDAAQHGNSAADLEIDKWAKVVGGEYRQVFAALAKIEWQSEAIRRDTIDLARTTLDRLIILRLREFMRDFQLWQAEKRDGADLPVRMDEIAALSEKMADILELHTDYSLWESYERLDKVEKVANPNFTRVLFDNAANGYCRSHQYELARHWYLPRARLWAKQVRNLVEANDRKAPLAIEPGENSRQRLMATPLETLKPTMPRTPENFRKVMEALARWMPRSGGNAANPDAIELIPLPRPRQFLSDMDRPVDFKKVTVSCAGEWLADHFEEWYGDNAPTVEEGAVNLPLPDGDEAYAVVADAAGVRIAARTLTGVRWAAYSLRQLAIAKRGTFKTEGFILPTLQIVDSPRLKFRGVHLCWFPETRPQQMERAIRLAAMMKFNYVVLESWGMYKSDQHPWWCWPKAKMTKAEVWRLVEIGRDLGVTLIPQINVFGHATMSRGVTVKNCALDLNPEYEPLFEPGGWNWCVTNPETQRVLRELIAEMYEDFGRPPYFHLGCDEAQPPTCPECRKAPYGDLAARHITGLCEYVVSLGARPMLWHDMLLNKGDARWRGFVAQGSQDTARMVDMLPKNAIICDWQYSYGDMKETRTDWPTIDYFRQKGFDVIGCPWRNYNAMEPMARHLQGKGCGGLLETTWTSLHGWDWYLMFSNASAAAWGTPVVGYPANNHESVPLFELRFANLLRFAGHDMKVDNYRDTGWEEFQVPPASWH